MADRKTLLHQLAVGDIFHAVYPNRAGVIGLVLAVDETTIYARRIGPTYNLKFNRHTGRQEVDDADQPQAVIDSVAPLPAEIHNAFVELDRRYREGEGLERFKLTDAEKKAHLFIADFYPANPLVKATQ